MGCHFGLAKKFPHEAKNIFLSIFSHDIVFLFLAGLLHSPVYHNVHMVSSFAYLFSFSCDAYKCHLMFLMATNIEIILQYQIYNIMSGTIVFLYLIFGYIEGCATLKWYP